MPETEDDRQLNDLIDEIGLLDGVERTDDVADPGLVAGVVMSGEAE